MAYSAIDKMRKKNEQIYGRDVGPMQPALSAGAATGFDLKSAALRFLHERCEGLLFDSQIEEDEERTGLYRGVSLAPGQIPYNMQMDINRLCLERELEKFLDSAATQDAYTVFYCFLEIFFGNYGKYKKKVELLSEYESNGSSLLMKHRDHYTHSVFVFALGLAIYETNENFRRTFNSYYHFDQAEDRNQESPEAAHFFLKYWGMTALFHDIGYPFELTFEQVMAFFEAGDDDRTANNPFIVYKNMKTMTQLSPRAQECFEKMYGRKFRSIDELLAFDLTQKLGPFYGFSEEYLLKTLKNKPVMPENFCGYMDHAYFSSLLLYQMLETAMESDPNEGRRTRPQVFEPAHVDALGAILLHYDLYTYSIAPGEDGTKPKLSMDMHPMAWLLLLCDELQCWDRTAYGRNSRKELHPMAVEFDFSGNRIFARYLYDEKEQDKIDKYLWAYVTWKQNGRNGVRPKLKAYSEMANEEKSFVRNIEQIVDTAAVPLTVVCDTAPVNRGIKRIYLSDSSFLHIHDFAVALNAGYVPSENEHDDVERSVMEKDFSTLSLEYKLSNINQVKSFSKCLNEIHCFYTDRQVDFDMLEAFTPQQIERIAPLEYERWLREHQAMGWRKGDLYEHVPVPQEADEKSYRSALREQTRCHKLAIDGELTKEQIISHYQEHLSEYEKQMNYQPFNNMLKLLKKFDGVRIYQYT